MQVNFKEYFREDDLLSGNVLRLINETQENINTNNKKEVKKMKLKKETISVDINVEHYGFYHNDQHFGNEHEPYRDWVIKKTGVKKWEDYHPGMWTTDIEMIDNWIEETKQPYETLFSEKDDGIYILPKKWQERIGI